jgi:hypothetical protein
MPLQLAVLHRELDQINKASPISVKKSQRMVPLYYDQAFRALDDGTE